MFSPAFRHNSANCGSTAITPAFAPWRPSTAPIRRTGRSARAPAQTPRPQLALKCQMLHLDVDNRKEAGRRVASAPTGTRGLGRSWSGSWSSQKQLASRQHVRNKRETSARYSRLCNSKEAGGDSIMDLPGAPSKFASSPPPEMGRQQLFDISPKHGQSATMARMHGINGSTQRNYICLKLHDDISSRNIAKKNIFNPAPGEVAVGDDGTISDHFSDTTDKYGGADISTEVHSFSSENGGPPCQSSDLNRSEKSVRFNLSTEVREYHPAVPLAECDGAQIDY